MDMLRGGGAVGLRFAVSSLLSAVLIAVCGFCILKRGFKCGLRSQEVLKRTRFCDDILVRVAVSAKK